MNIYDISRRAGVSIATVSRVLNNSTHVSQKTKDKVMAVINESGYVPNAFARGLGLNTMKTIGLLCPNAADSYLAQALGFLEQEFRNHQYNCVLSCTGKELAAREDGVSQLMNRHVDGLVLMGSSFIEENDADNEYIRQAAKVMPVVILNGSFLYDNVYCVLCDDRRATKEACRFLVESGCKHVLYLHHSRNYSGQKKLQGYCEGLESCGMPVRKELIHLFSEDKMSVPHVRDYLVHLHEEGLQFDAVLSSEDILAVGAAKYARVVHQSIPKQLSIIGYNNSNFCLCCEPELTSVDNRLNALCSHCVTTMLGVLEGREMPQRTVFTAEMVRRGSTL